MQTKRNQPNVVMVSNRDVQKFRAAWPCSGIHPNARFVFTFERNGDLADVWCSHKYEDGSAIVALSDDALNSVVVQLLPESAGHLERLRPDNARAILDYHASQSSWTQPRAVRRNGIQY